MGEWREWMIQTFSEDKSNFVTAERKADGWNFNRFTCNPFTKEITRLQAELAEARDKAAEIVRDEVYAEAHDTEWDTGFNYAKSLAIRALKSPKPQED